MHDLQLTVNVTKYVTILQYINQLQYNSSTNSVNVSTLGNFFLLCHKQQVLGLLFWSCPALYFISSITTQRTACDNRHWSRALSTGLKKAMYMTVNFNTYIQVGWKKSMGTRPVSQSFLKGGSKIKRRRKAPPEIIAN